MTASDMFDVFAVTMFVSISGAACLVLYSFLTDGGDDEDDRFMATTDERAVAERDAEQRWLQYKRERELDDVIARITGIHRDSERTRISMAERKQFEIDKDSA